MFQPGDKVRLNVMTKKDPGDIVLTKTVEVTEVNNCVDIVLTHEDTRIGEIINKQVDYWYEVQLNPDTEAQTIVGYDEDGPKILTLYPEGGESDV